MNILGEIDVSIIYDPRWVITKFLILLLCFLDNNSSLDLDTLDLNSWNSILKPTTFLLQ